MSSSWISNLKSSQLLSSSHKKNSGGSSGSFSILCETVGGENLEKTLKTGLNLYFTLFDFGFVLFDKFGLWLNKGKFDELSLLLFDVDSPFDFLLFFKFWRRTLFPIGKLFTFL